MTDLVDLIVEETAEAFYSRALSTAVTVGLPVTTWETGDPTRSMYHVLSAELSTLEAIAARYVAAGFLDLAARSDDSKWIKLAAYQKYGYTAREATFATCTMRLTNNGGGVYTIDAQSLTFAKTGDPDVTYRNTTGGTLLAGPGTTLDLSVECEVAGSTGSASIGEIDIVTVLGAGTVDATNITTAVGADEETATSIVAGCRAKLDALSPNGAAGAYAYVALNAELTGAGDVTRVRVVPNATTGDVTVYLAGASGGVTTPDRGLVEAALLETATPLCITLTVTSASALPVNITYTAKAYSSVGVSTATIEAAIAASLGTMFASIPIGGDGDDGEVTRAKIIHAIVSTYPGYLFDVSLSVPAIDVSLTASQVATVGSVSGVVTLEAPP